MESCRSCSVARWVLLGGLPRGKAQGATVDVRGAVNEAWGLSKLTRHDLLHASIGYWGLALEKLKDVRG